MTERDEERLRKIGANVALVVLLIVVPVVLPSIFLGTAGGSSCFGLGFLAPDTTTDATTTTTDGGDTTTDGGDTTTDPCTGSPSLTVTSSGPYAAGDGVEFSLHWDTESDVRVWIDEDRSGTYESDEPSTIIKGNDSDDFDGALTVDALGETEGPTTQAKLAAVEKFTNDTSTVVKSGNFTIDTGIDTAGIVDPASGSSTDRAPGEALNVMFDADDEYFDHATLVLVDESDTVVDVVNVTTGGTGIEASLTVPTDATPGANLSVKLTVDDTTGNTETVTRPDAVNVTRPASVTAITRSSPPERETALTSVEFVVAFSESVENVDATDFRLATGGSVSGSVTGVNRSIGDSVTVTVDSLSGTGTLGLDVANGTDIVGSEGAVFDASEPATDETYAVDTVAPTFEAGGSASAATDEERTGVVLDVAADDDGGTNYDTDVTYTLGGSDAGPFSIDSATGELSFDSPPDYETPTDADADSQYELTVTATDDVGNTDTQSVTVTVDPVNEAPTLGGTGAATTVDESTAPDDGTPPVQLVSDASVSDPDVGAAPALSAFGAGTVTVSMDDGGQPFDHLTLADESLAGVASVSGGADGSDLVVDLTTDATTAEVDAILESVRYRSSSDTADGTRTITVTLNDGNNDNGATTAGGPSALTDALSASVAIDEQNDPPTGSDTTVTTDEDTPYTFTAADFGYSQPGGETDTFDGLRIDTVPESGYLTVDGAPVSAGDVVSRADVDAGELTYYPAPNASGDGLASVEFSVRDDRGAFDTTSNTITVDVTPVNDAPSATPSGDVTVDEDTTASLSDFMTDVAAGGAGTEDDQTVTFAVESVTDGAGYTVDQLFDSPPSFTDATGADNTLAFTPSDLLPAGVTETVAVTVSVTDDGGTANGGDDTGDDQTFTVEITGVNDAPTSSGLADRASDDGESVSVDAAAAFSDVDTGDSLSYTATGLPPGLSLDATTGTVSGTIDHAASASNPYTVEVTAADGTGASASATFTWTVANPPPAAADDTDTTDEDSSITRDAASGVLGNDADTAPDSDPLTVDRVAGDSATVGSAVAGTNGGQFTLNADGSYTFAPDGDFEDMTSGETRTTAVTYRVADGNGGTDTATLSVTVTGINDAPATEAGPDRTVDVDTSVSFDATGSSDPDDAIVAYEWTVGDGTTLTGATPPAHSYGLPGTYQVTLTTTDAAGNTDTDTLTVDVVDRTAPRAEAGPDRTVANGTAVIFSGTRSTDNTGIDRYAWDFDADGTPDTTGWTVAHTFPAPGTYRVALTVTDTGGNTDTDTLRVTVTKNTSETCRTHVSGVCQSVFDAAAGADEALDRTDVLAAVRDYVNDRPTEDIELTRAQVLTLVGYYVRGN